MVDWDGLCFNTAVFISGVFVLDYGADKFLDHTVIVGQRLGISPTLIALLTAGAEYEELAVVVAAILQHRGPMALGNVMGSTISNILGAFSIGLLCHPGRMEFDKSAKIYSLLLLVVTTLFVGLAFFNQLHCVTGGILIGIFVVYLISIGYAVYKGITEPPQLSDSDSDRDSDDEIPTVDEEQHATHRGLILASESTPLLGDGDASNGAGGRKPARALYYHVFQLFFGLLALTLSGYILAHSAGAIADALHLSGTVIGLTVIAFATTLPEKLISVLSGFRGQGGIVVATAAGSNIFLLTLCVGVVAVSGGLVNQGDTFVLFDLAMVWASAISLVAVVLFAPSSRIAGLVLFAAYIAFLVLEFTVFRR
ncbi:Sodium/calcium exchanger protein-domain-containing protein [Aspergillus pseudoustus]|uniref:Sodium/calcium exchanger protein-domain-containing protein n=1 Tax=Aspergillus pseudoustus TaxID=1810923 RepID=A0ABR4JXM5_9EURO